MHINGVKSQKSGSGTKNEKRQIKISKIDLGFSLFSDLGSFLIIASILAHLIILSSKYIAKCLHIVFLFMCRN